MSEQVIYGSLKKTSTKTSNSLKKVIIITAIGVLVIGITYAYYLFNKKTQSIAGEKPHYIMTATALVSEFELGEKEANSKFLGKIIEVSGVVTEKTKNSNGMYNLTIQGADLAGVGCEFEPAANKTVAAIKEGEIIKVKGICSGVLMDVILVNCSVILEN